METYLCGLIAVRKWFSLESTQLQNANQTLCVLLARCDVFM